MLFCHNYNTISLGKATYFEEISASKTNQSKTNCLKSIYYLQ